jgi:RNA polymerase subunit RPABC4/transcription elongation factor Spt4
MEQKAFHGNIAAADIANALVAEFNQGNLQAQAVGSGDRIVVQIASRAFRSSGGQTAVTVILEKIEDGVMIQLGDQQWIGVAASLGSAAISALRNPLSLIGSLDDIAQDITSIQLSELIWQTIQRSVAAAGAGHEISDRLRRVECAHCGAAVPVGESTCPACGAPLGAIQPKACPQCGFVPPAKTAVCPKCKARISP